MNQTNRIRTMLLAASAEGHRLFRQNVGLAWVGEIARKTETSITLTNYRPLHAGLCKGSSDVIGWSNVGRFVALEDKSATDRATPDQSRFLSAVASAGGISGVFRSSEEALAILARGAP